MTLSGLKQKKILDSVTKLDSPDEVPHVSYYTHHTINIMQLTITPNAFNVGSLKGPRYSSTLYECHQDMADNDVWRNFLLHLEYI